MSVRVLICVLMVAAAHQGALADWWMNQPYGNRDFSKLVQYGHNVTLDCVNNDTLYDEYDFSYWVRSDLTVMREGENETRWSIDGTAGWYVNETGEHLHVYTVQEYMFGFYHCILVNPNDSQDVYVSKTAINWEGPYYGNLWEKYRRNTIIACGAAAGFLALSVICMMICRFAYDPEEDDDGYSLSDISSIKDLDPQEGSSGNSDNSGSPGDIRKAKAELGPEIYDNQAYVKDGDVVVQEHSTGF